MALRAKNVVAAPGHKPRSTRTHKVVSAAGRGHSRPKTVSEVPVVTVSPTGHVTATGPRAAQRAARTHRAIRNVHFVEHTLGAPDPRAALYNAYYRGQNPDYPALQKAYGTPFAQAVEKAYHEHLARHENLGEPEDITHAIEAGTVLTGIPAVLRGLGELGGKAAVKEIASEAGSAIAKSAAETAASTGEKKGASAALKLLDKAAGKGPISRAFGRTGAGRAIAKQAERLPQSVRTAGRVAALPLRKPLTAPFAAQAPVAAFHGNPGELGKAVQGSGVYASALNAIGDHIAGALPPGGLLGNAAKDALNLPATVLPSLYLVGTHPKTALKQYEQTGFLPKLARGEFGGALKQAGEHPVYSGLELSGLSSVIGRSSGALARNLTGGKLASTERPPVHIQGLEHVGNVNAILGRERYSPDLIRQLAQRYGPFGSDRARIKKTGGPYATDRQAARVLRKDVPDRYAYAREQIRRVGRQEITHAMHEARPKKGRFRTDRASAGVVSLAVQGIIRSPGTFTEDLKHYKQQLLDEAAKKDPKTGKPLLSRYERSANKKLIGQIDKALEHGNPEEVVRAANAFIHEHAKLTRELVDRGLLDAQQADKAAAIPFARVHMGAQYGKPEQLIADLKDVQGSTRASNDIRVIERPSSKPVATNGVFGDRTPFVYNKKARVLEVGPQGAGHGDVFGAKLENGNPDVVHGEIQLVGKEAVFKYPDGKDNPEAPHVLAALRQHTGEDIRTADQWRTDTHPNGAGEPVDLEKVAQAIRNASREQVLDRHGNPLSLEDIQAEMKRRGVGEVGFLTHRPPTPSRGGAFFRSFFPERQKLPTGKRTGQAVTRGTFDASYRALAEQAIRSRSIVDAVHGFDEFLKQNAIKAPAGVKTLGDAHDALRNPEHYDWNLSPELQKEGKRELVPLRTAPFNAAKREFDAAERHQQVMDPQNGPVLEGIAHKALTDAAEGGGGPIVFVPKAMYDRLLQHFAPGGGVDKGAQFVNTLFKGAVLPFSPSFYVGNFVDNAIRAAMSGIGPSDVALGRKAVTGKTIFGRQVSEPLPPAATESILPGALYASFKRINPYRDARQFKGTAAEPIARVFHALHETHGPKEAVAAFTATRNFLLEVNSRLFERLPQYGALGKELRRDLQARTGYWHHALTISDGAFQDLTKGLRSTDKQIQYAKSVEQVFGNWGKNGPAARSALANLVPFWQWARAATRFVWLTLPAHHPIKTALIAAASEMTRAERERYGLDIYAKEALPGFLQGNIPLNGGITSNLSKYSSFGVFGDYAEFISRMFFGQGATSLSNLQGLDWKGDKLTKADGTPAGETERIEMAVLSAAESFIPGFNLIQAVAEGNVGKFNPLATESGEKLKYLRGLSTSQQITVPAKKSSSSSVSSGPSAEDYVGALEGSSTESSAENYLKALEGG